MSQHNLKIGRWGENMAAAHLIKQGYEILNRNVYTPYGEIDLIAQKNGFIIFVEVKTGTSQKFGHPEINVTPAKQQHLLNAAAHIAQENDYEQWQIDVITIEGKLSNFPTITHFENVFS